MSDPMAEIGIKLTDGWSAQAVRGGVLFSGHKTVLVGAAPRQPWEWATVLRHHQISFEGYGAVPAPEQCATVAACT